MNSAMPPWDWPAAFGVLSEMLAGATAAMGAAESHGLLTGFICSHDTDNRGLSGPGNGFTDGLPASPGVADGTTNWLSRILGETPSPELSGMECRHLLGYLEAETRRQLAGPDKDFRMLLPGDDEPLSVRCEALGKWCQGFLYGLGLRGSTESGWCSGDAREIVSDFAEIARLETDTEDTEEGEVSYTELVEYVRVSVMLLNETFKQPPTESF